MALLLRMVRFDSFDIWNKNHAVKKKKKTTLKRVRIPLFFLILSLRITAGLESFPYYTTISIYICRIILAGYISIIIMVITLIRLVASSAHTDFFNGYHCGILYRMILSQDVIVLTIFLHFLLHFCFINTIMQTVYKIYKMKMRGHVEWQIITVNTIMIRYEWYNII